ncbi:MAG: long-chain acyl-CoA synthetase, partial [Candidatus Azotimanducaceae bacterium]
MTFARAYAAEKPEEIAIRDPQQALKWADVDDVLNRCANGLQSMDLGPETRIAVFAENAVETAMANLGGLIAGASVVPVNFHLTAEEVAYILTDSDAKVLFVGPETWERGVEAAAESNVHTVVGWGAPADAPLTHWSDWLAGCDAGEPDQDVPPR